MPWKNDLNLGGMGSKPQALIFFEINLHMLFFLKGNILYLYKLGAKLLKICFGLPACRIAEPVFLEPLRGENQFYYVTIREYFSRPVSRPKFRRLYFSRSRKILVSSRTEIRNLNLEKNFMVLAKISECRGFDYSPVIRVRYLTVLLLFESAKIFYFFSFSRRA